MPKGTCSIEGCERPITARRFCAMHYQRWRKHGDPPWRLDDPKRLVCSIKGCGKPLYGLTWCSAHYTRQRRHGSTAKPKGRRGFRGPLPSRFWSRVDVGEPAICHPWQRSRTEGGYGRIVVDGRIEMAHRVAWLLTYGPIPDGLCVCHTCDNPPCCNPLHLWLGTHQDNMDDMVAKGRSAKRRKETP